MGHHQAITGAPCLHAMPPLPCSIAAPRQAPRGWETGLLTRWPAALWLALVAGLLCLAWPVWAIDDKPARLSSKRSTKAAADSANARGQPAGLDAAVQAKGYELSLTIDPKLPRYQGQVQIDIALSKASQTIQLQAQGLQIGGAFIETGAHRWAAKVQQVDAQHIALRTAKPVPAGPARLVIGFSGPLSATASQGLLRRQTGGRWWVLARLDAQGASLGLPVLDVPGGRVPWRLSLTVPDDLQALANTPLAQTEAAEPGFKRLHFEPTPPTPSQQLAWAVGAFELTPAAVGPVPLRWAVPAGMAWPMPDGSATQATQVADLEGIAAAVNGHLARLEATLGQPYPYVQLDLLVLPAGSGLVTTSQPGLLAWPPDAGAAPLGEALARGWLGQLLSPASNSDRWLLDALAARLGQPSPGTVAAPPSAPSAAAQQALVQAETTLGPTTWLAVLRRFVERHAWGLASVTDFVAALATADAAQAEVLRQALAAPQDKPAELAKP